MYKIVFFILSIITFTLQLNASFTNSEKDHLFNLFKTDYYWAKQIFNQTYSQYTNPKEMIKAVRYSTYDSWSYGQTLEDYQNQVNQVTKGFGCYYDNNGVIVFIEIDSPADKAGLKRGDKITHINGKNASAEVYYEADSNLGVISIFTVKRNDQTLNISIKAQEYNYKVTKANIFVSKTTGKKVGHMIFNSFTGNAVDEIEDIFTYFKKNRIDELVVDLRYNGGGSLNIASILLDKIAGYGREDELQGYLNWNQNNQENNEFYYFMEDENSIPLDRVFFLTTEHTASASEMVINSLKPYLDVKVIGSTTHGKPVGMRGKYNLAQDYIYWLINFGMLNANGEGDYFNGISAYCRVSDNISFLRDDVNGDMVHEALHYIEKGFCSNGGGSSKLDHNTFVDIESIIYKPINIHQKYTISSDTTQYYNISLEKNGKLLIDIEEDLTVHIYDQQMNIVYENINQSSFKNLDAGKYHIWITNNNKTYSNHAIFYSPSLDSNPISNKGYTTSPYTFKERYYKLNMPTAGNLDIETYDKLYITIYDMDYNIVSSRKDTDQTIPLSQGEYIVKIHNTTDDYLSVYFYTPVLDSLNNFPTLKYNSYVSGIDETVYYYLDINQDGNIQIDRTANIDVTIYDLNMNLILNNLEQDQLVLLKQGKYIVKMSSRYYNYSRYVKFYIQTLDPLKNFLQIESNKIYDVGGKSVIYYSLNLSEDSFVDSTYTNEYGIGSNGEYYFSVFDQNMNLIHSKVKNTFLNEGDYIIKVNTNSSVNSNELSFYISSKDTREVNNIEVNKDYTHIGENINYYTFELLTNSEIIVNSESSLEVVILDEGFNIIDEVSNGFKLIGLNAGKYFIKTVNVKDSGSLKFHISSDIEDFINGKTYKGQDGFNYRYIKLVTPRYGRLDFNKIEGLSYLNIINEKNERYNDYFIYDSVIIYLSGGQKILQLEFSGSYSKCALFSNSSSLSNLEVLKTDNYTFKGDNVKYYKLDLQSYGDVIFSMQKNYNTHLEIYDLDYNSIFSSFDLTHKSISLDKGIYIVRIVHTSYRENILNIKMDLFDTDADGISDEYESKNGLDPNVDDSGLDLDNDGKTNLEEYQAGTKANDTNSRLFTLSLKKGWNLVSLELNSSVDLNTINNPNIEVVRSLKDDKWNTWTKENLNNPDQYFDTIEDGYGYWIKATQDTSLDIKGDRLPDSKIITPNRWNMVGSQEIADIKQFFTDNPGVKMIWKYIGGKYHVISSDNDLDTDLSSLENSGNVIKMDRIEKNEGFFVK